MGPEHFWWGGWWFFPMIMPFMMVLVLAVLLYFVFWRGGVRPPWWSDIGVPSGPPKPPETAMEILKKRYAKGEITKEEFDRIKRDIA